MQHYENIYGFWNNNPGIGISKSDSKESISAFLKRNEGLSFIAYDKNNIIGGILGGHDGRRGYIYHLIVDENYRFKGIGKALVSKCINKFKEIGLEKSHIFIFKNNEQAKAFWNKIGWSLRNDIEIMSLNIK